MFYSQTPREVPDEEPTVPGNVEKSKNSGKRQTGHCQKAFSFLCNDYYCFGWHYLSKFIRHFYAGI